MQIHAISGRTDNGYHAGMALVSCAVILIIISMLALATRQIVAESAAASLNAQDRLLALEAARAALADAEQTIGDFPDDVAMRKNGQDLPVVYGSLTANQLPFGGHLQPTRLPVYRIFLKDFSEDQEQGTARYQYQVTALGIGWRESTQVVLQSEFLKLVCLDQNIKNCSTQPQGRRSWRELSSLPAEADAKP